MIRNDAFVDDFKLESQMLLGDEPKVLYETIVSLEKEKMASKYPEAREGSRINITK